MTHLLQISALFEGPSLNFRCEMADLPFVARRFFRWLPRACLLDTDRLSPFLDQSHFHLVICHGLGCRCFLGVRNAVADLGERPGSPLILGKK